MSDALRGPRAHGGPIGGAPFELRETVDGLVLPPWQAAFAIAQT